MKYTKEDIKVGFQFTNDFGKGKIYEVKSLNSSGKTCHLIGVNVSYDMKTYDLESILTLISKGAYVPLIPKEICYEIY